MAEKMTGAEMVIQALADQGVEHIFGYPGGAALPIYDAMFQQEQVQHGGNAGAYCSRIPDLRWRGGQFCRTGPARPSRTDADLVHASLRYDRDGK